jgi:DNA-binding MarR family transcriptional regulator
VSVGAGKQRSAPAGGARAAAGREDEAGPRLIYAIGRYDTALRTELKRRLAALDLTLAEFTTLSVLRARSGLSNAQLARRSLVTPQAMNQVLASLEDKGLVRRQSSPGHDSQGHHRARATRLTPKGARRSRRCDTIVDEIEDASFQGLSASERITLAVMLRSATERLRARAQGDVDD